MLPRQRRRTDAQPPLAVGDGDPLDVQRAADRGDGVTGP